MSVRPGGILFIVAGLALAGLARAGTSPTAANATLTIQGRVVSPSKQPIAGATVFVYTAQPRVGLGSTCPSCYPECAKQAVTDKKGRFAISGLGDHLLYRLLFVADGAVAEFRDRVDPREPAFEQVLRARDPALAPGLRSTVGHVVDPRGKPVVGASVSPQGIRVERGFSFGDHSKGNARIQPIAITDATGTFHLVGPDSITAWVLAVRARDLAPRVFPNVAADSTTHLLKLERGAIVTGLVTREGQPVPGAVIGIAQVDRNAFNSVRPDTIAADERGRFTFVNVPEAQDYAISGVVGTMGPWALRTVVRTVGENDSTTVLPTLQLERGYRLEGRVTLADGKPLPAGTELALGRGFAFSSMVVPVGPGGGFRLEGLPPETITLGIRVAGYRLAPATPGFTDPLRPAVRIPMLRDRTDVEIVLEPEPPSPASGPPRP